MFKLDTWRKIITSINTIIIMMYLLGFFLYYTALIFLNRGRCQNFNFNL